MSVRWLVGWLVGWMNDWLVGWLACFSDIISYTSMLHSEHLFAAKIDNSYYSFLKTCIIDVQQSRRRVYVDMLISI